MAKTTVLFYVNLMIREMSSKLEENVFKTKRAIYIFNTVFSEKIIQEKFLVATLDLRLLYVLATQDRCSMNNYFSLKATLTKFPTLTSFFNLQVSIF